jgi:23S rRNA (pseudouridine1915-N3)-methyltransferase
VRFRLLCVDKVRDANVAALVDEFAKRLRRYHHIDIVEVRASNGTDPARAMREEATALLRHVTPGDQLWLLDRSGEEMSSEELAKRFAAAATAGTSAITLAVGGAYGADRTLFERADMVWSLSRLTILHEWARALVVEQLYRATKIERGEPYHT